jgi:hypothetical protein
VGGELKYAVGFEADFGDSERAHVFFDMNHELVPIEKH